MEIKIKKLSNASLLKYHSDGASGFDCNSTIDVSLSQFERCKIPLGFCLEIPHGYEGQVRSRSGLSLKEGLIVISGTIDSDYRGEVCAIVVNMDSRQRIISRGQRIAQFVIAPIIRADFEFVDQLDSTIRGENGFGSTGS